MSPEKKQKITDAREKATEEKEKVRGEVKLQNASSRKLCMLSKGFINKSQATELNMLHSSQIFCMWWYLFS